jgi:hypothetical protein
LNDYRKPLGYRGRVELQHTLGASHLRHSYRTALLVTRIAILYPAQYDSWQQPQPQLMVAVANAQKLITENVSRPRLITPHLAGKHVRTLSFINAVACRFPGPIEASSTCTPFRRLAVYPSMT